MLKSVLKAQLTLQNKHLETTQKNSSFYQLVGETCLREDEASSGAIQMTQNALFNPMTLYTDW